MQSCIFYQLITITIILSIHCYFVNHLLSTLFDQSNKIIWTINCGYCYGNNQLQSLFVINHMQSILFLSYNVFMQHLCDQFNVQHIQPTYFDQLNCEIWKGWNLYCFCCMLNVCVYLWVVLWCITLLELLVFFIYLQTKSFTFSDVLQNKNCFGIILGNVMMKTVYTHKIKTWKLKKTIQVKIQV